MTRIHVGIACTGGARARYFLPDSVARLERVADVAWLEFPGSDREPGRPDDPASISRLAEFAASLDALVVSYGAPRVDEEVLTAAPRLRFVGDTHGDRFADRIDVAAATRRGVTVVDTTNASSDPVAEWALALMLIGLRNAGALFRRLVAGEVLWVDRTPFLTDPGYLGGELRGKTVGLVALGRIGVELVRLLEPIGVTVLAYDPYAPPALASSLDVELTSLDVLMRHSDVVVNLVPLTAETHGLIGPASIHALRSGAVFVNVSRGAVVDTPALIARLERGDVIACLDVVDPEPLPADSPLRKMPNVFLSPHIAGVTAQAEPRFFDRMVDELTRFANGYEPHHPLVPRRRPDPAS
jgi:phosphoglycerate dehydrogenase-like enzyme